MHSEGVTVMNTKWRAGRKESAFRSAMSECVRNADASKRGSASNTSYIGTDLGNFLGSNTAGFLVAYLGYRKMYMAVVVPIIICTIVFVVKKRKKKELSAVDTVSVNTQED